MVFNEQNRSEPLATETKEGKVKKSRNRIPTSCSVCRRRKIKCDKAKPYCGSCVTNKLTEMCQYNQQPWEYISTEKHLSNEILRLKMRINQLERSVAENDSHITPPDSRSGESGEIDPLMDLGARFDQLVIKENKLLHYASTSFMGIQSNDPVLKETLRRFLEKHRERYKKEELGVENMIPKSEREELCWTSKEVLETTIDLLAPYKQQELVDSLNESLPSHNFILILVDYFFKKAYPLFPVLDEEIFREDLPKVLKKSADGRPRFELSDSSATATISICLLIMRIAYLVMPLSDFVIDSERIKDADILRFLSSGVEIGPSYVEHAKNLIMGSSGSENILNKVTFSNIQTLVLLKLYKAFSPEDGDETANSSILLAIIVQMCKIQGLHRDPERFKDVIEDRRVRHLRRKLWHTVILMDLTQAMQFGTLLVVSDDQWDCKLPALTNEEQAFLDNFDANLVEKTISSDTERQKTLEKYSKLYGELRVVENFERQYRTCEILREVVHLCHHMKYVPRRSDFVNLISKVERNFHNNSVHDLIYDKKNKRNVHDQISNILLLRDKCHLFLVRYILSYMLLLESEDEKEIDQSFNNLFGEDSEYLVKTTECSIYLFKIAYDFLLYETEDDLSCSDPVRYGALKDFYGNYDKLVASNILINASRSLQFLSSITLRFGVNFFSFSSLIRYFSNYQDSIDCLKWFNISLYDLKTNVDVSIDKQFSIMLFKYIKVFYSKCNILKDKYFHCLRISFTIKLFINYLKFHLPETYDQLNGLYTVAKDSYGVPGVQSESNEANGAVDAVLKEFNVEDVMMDDLILENEEQLMDIMLDDKRLLAHTLLPDQDLMVSQINFDGDSNMVANADTASTPNTVKLDSLQNIFSPPDQFYNNFISQLGLMGEFVPEKQDSDFK